jgi:nitrate reductase beta subunit
VGRIRYLGVLLYDADQIQKAASVASEQDLYGAQLNMFLDPFDPQVIRTAREQGIPESWLEAARQSPVYKMAMEWKVAFPLHPEYRTLPMVWYVPPLSPIQAAADSGTLGRNGEIPDIDSLRIPLKYLANMLTAGDEAPVKLALERMLAMRAFMRSREVDGELNTRVLEPVDLTIAEVEAMYRYMAIANYEDRFVIPSSHAEYTRDAYGLRSGCGFSFGNAGSPGVSEVSLFGGKPPTRRSIPVKFESQK